MPAPLTFALASLVLIAAIYDFRFRRIPNWLNLSGFVLGIGLNTLLFAQHGLVAAVFGTLVALLIYLPMYLVRAMGAGDLKLMAAVGALAGPQHWLWILLYTALAGGAIAIVVAAARGRVRRTVANTGLVLNHLMHFEPPATRNEELDVRSQRALRLPHAVAIAAGSLIFIASNS
jgi:prepilin peptidase CpaA